MSRFLKIKLRRYTNWRLVTDIGSAAENVAPFQPWLSLLRLWLHTETHWSHSLEVRSHLWQCVYLVAGLMYLGVLLHTPLKLPMASLSRVFLKVGQCEYKQSLSWDITAKSLVSTCNQQLISHRWVNSLHVAQQRQQDVHLLKGQKICFSTLAS